MALSVLGEKLLQQGQIMCFSDNLKHPGAVQDYLKLFSATPRPGKITVPGWDGVSIPKLKIYSSFFFYDSEQEYLQDLQRLKPLEGDQVCLISSPKMNYIQVVFSDQSALMSYI